MSQSGRSQPSPTVSVPMEAPPPQRFEQCRNAAFNFASAPRDDAGDRRPIARSSKRLAGLDLACGALRAAADRHEPRAARTMSSLDKVRRNAVSSSGSLASVIWYFWPASTQMRTASARETLRQQAAPPAHTRRPQTRSDGRRGTEFLCWRCSVSANSIDVVQSPSNSSMARLASTRRDATTSAASRSICVPSTNVRALSPDHVYCSPSCPA